MSGIDDHFSEAPAGLATKEHKEHKAPKKRGVCFAIQAEVNAGDGDTIIAIVGCPDFAFKESRKRANGRVAQAAGRPLGRFWQAVCLGHREHTAPA